MVLHSTYNKLPYSSPGPPLAKALLIDMLKEQKFLWNDWLFTLHLCQRSLSSLSQPMSLALVQGQTCRRNISCLAQSSGRISCCWNDSHSKIPPRHLLNLVNEEHFWSSFFGPTYPPSLFQKQLFYACCMPSSLLIPNSGQKIQALSRYLLFIERTVLQILKI